MIEYIEQPTEGLTSSYGSVDTGIQGAKGQYSTSTAISLFRANRRGHISAGEGFTAMTDTSGYVTDLPLNAVAASNGYFYSILKNGRIVKFQSSVSDKYDPASAISTSYGDIFILKDADTTPTEYILYTYETASKAYLGYIKTDFTGGSATFLELTKGVPHIFVSGPTPNDIAITNGQYLATVTVSGAMASATLQQQGLNLGSGWTLTSGTTYGNYVAVVGYKSISYITGFNRSECRMWLWNFYSPDPLTVTPIEDNYVSMISNDRGALKIWTRGRDYVARVQVYNPGRNSFEVLAHRYTAPDTPMYHGSVERYQDMVHWAQGNAIWCLDGNALHQRTVADGATEIGFVKTLATNLIYAGVLLSPSGYAIYSSDTAKYINFANFRTRQIELPHRANLKAIYIYFSQFAASSSVIVSLFKDYNATAIGGATDLLNHTINTTNNPTVTTDLFVKFDKVIPNVNSFYLNLYFNHATGGTGAIIRAIAYEYEKTDKP